MKRLFLFNILLLSISAFSADVKIGNENVGIAFEDETLKEADKAIIIEDIRLVFSTGKEITFRPYEKKDKHCPGKDGFLDTNGKSYYWPSIFRESSFYHYRINPQTSKKELLVSKQMSDMYLQAIKFKETHKKEFKKLDKFLKRVEKGFQPEKMTMAEKKELFWFVPGRAIFKEESFNYNLRSITTYSILYPSLLAFQDLEIENVTILCCVITIQRKENGNLSDAAIVYDKNKWKILVF